MVKVGCPDVIPRMSISCNNSNRPDLLIPAGHIGTCFKPKLNVSSSLAIGMVATEAIKASVGKNFISEMQIVYPLTLLIPSGNFRGTFILFTSFTSCPFAFTQPSIAATLLFTQFQLLARLIVHCCGYGGAVGSISPFTLPETTLFEAFTTIFSKTTCTLASNQGILMTPFPDALAGSALVMVVTFMVNSPMDSESFTARFCVPATVSLIVITALHDPQFCPDGFGSILLESTPFPPDTIDFVVPPFPVSSELESNLLFCVESFITKDFFTVSVDFTS